MRAWPTLRSGLAALLLAALALPSAAEAAADAAGPPAGTGRTLVVGTKHAPPFAISRADGGWEGVSLELWRDVAKELGLEFRLEERTLGGLLEGLEDGSLDVVAAALTLTPEREERMDFSHPYYTSGLGIAVAAQGGQGWLRSLSHLLSLDLLKALLALALVLFAAGFGLWVFERRRNPEQFGGRPLHGLGAAFWWSAVTMTTVGYGDKAPLTLGGRLVALVWMFASILMISGFTAAIASSLTLANLGHPVQGPDDLGKVRVATVAGSTSDEYLQRRGLGAERRASVEDTLRDLVAGRVEAVVYDAPILRYLASQGELGHFVVLPGTFERQGYSFGLPSGSPLREDLNRQLLRRLESPEWERTLERYLGR